MKKAKRFENFWGKEKHYKMKEIFKVKMLIEIEKRSFEKVKKFPRAGRFLIERFWREKNR